MKTWKILKGEGIYADEHELKKDLAGMGLLPIKVRVKKFWNTEIENLSFFEEPVGILDIALFCRQFAIMLDTGISIGRALKIAKEESKKIKLKRGLDAIYKKVEQGELLSHAMKEEKIFMPFIVSMIEVGEISGKLEEILYQLADYLEEQLEIRNQIKKAFIYPMIVVVLLGCVLPILMIEVIPAFTEMFIEMEATLPISTQIIIEVSDWISKYWAIILIFSVSVILLFTRLKKTQIGKNYYDAFTLRLPLVGNVKKQLLTKEFSQMMALLMSSGIPILQAMEKTKLFLGSESAKRELEHMIGMIKSGHSFKEALKRSKIYPPMMLSMVSIGEETGTLDSMLVKVSQYFSLKTREQIDRMTILIEPILILIIGLIVGFIVFAITAPTFTLANKFI